jgi:spermidine synthase
MTGRVLAKATTVVNDMRVVQTGLRVDLDVDGATHATWHPNDLLTGYSWDALAVGAMLGADVPKSVLILGMGGGTVARQLRFMLPALDIVGVELDPEVLSLARQHLHLDDAQATVVMADAYAYLAEAGACFDVIVDDLFLSGPEDVVRARVPEGETMALLRSRLNPGGVLVANTITDEGQHRAVADAAQAAFQSSFRAVVTVTPPRGLNQIVVGSDGGLHGLDILATRMTHPFRAADQKRFNQLRVVRVGA